MRNPTLHKIFPALGTVNTLSAAGDCNRELMDRIRHRVLALHHLFSVFEPTSDISRINSSAGISPVPIHADTFRILSAALLYEKETDGAFSIFTGPSARLWKEAIRTGRVPGEKEITACHALCQGGSLILNEKAGTAFLTQRGQEIDLGGIAKGYAADEAAGMLREAGVCDALINFGGTVMSLGRKRKVGIRNPFGTETAPVSAVPVRNAAVVTSGSYEQGFTAGGRYFHHIIDPRTGRPADSGLVSATLIGKNATALDALATAVCVMGEEDSRSLLRRRKIRSILIRTDGSLHTSKRLAALMPDPGQEVLNYG